MMTVKIQIIIGVFLLIALVVIINMIRKRQLELKYSIPYADVDHLDDPVIKMVAEEDGYCWGHSLEDQIQGQIAAGFVIAGFYEDCGFGMFDPYINTSMATRAIKMDEI